MIDKILCIGGAALITRGVLNAIDDGISPRSVFNILLGIVDIVEAFI